MFNYSEWTLDRYTPYWGPKDRVDPLGVAGDISRVVRGGGAFDIDSDCRSARRDSRIPDARRPGLGFRIVIGPALDDGR